MRSRVIVKCREKFGYYYEKIMELLHPLCYRIIPATATRNNLTEEYAIYEQYAGEPFVRDFLEERTRKAMTNRYGIKIKTTVDNTDDEADDNTPIGKVRLLRKKCVIDQATLTIKNDGNNLIYWNFNK